MIANHIDVPSYSFKTCSSLRVAILPTARL